MRAHDFSVTRIGVGEDRGRSIWLALGTLTVIALILRLACLTGLVGDDDLKYARYAQAITQGGYAQAVAEARGQELLHWAIRFGLLVPLAAIYKVVGVSEWSTIALPLLASTASVPLLALIGRHLFDWRVGMIAGLLYATFPLQLRYATVLVPEPIAECFALIGVLCYLQGQRRAVMWYLVAGVAFGTAYLTKESALFIAGALMLHALWERQWRGVLFLGLGLIGVLAVEHGYYVLAHGDILFRLHATVLYGPENTGPANPDLMYRWFKYYPRRMLVPSVFFGLHSLACLTWAALALALKPRAGYRLLLLWAVIPWLYLNFGTSSLERYVVLPAQQRYIEFTYPPLMLLSGVVLSRALAERARVAVATAVVLAIVCVAGVVSGVAMRGRAGRVAADMTVLREIAHRAQGVSDRKIHSTDPRWRDALSIFDPSLVSASRDAAAFILSPDPLGLPSLQKASPRPAGRDSP